jgi:hypothetical protein
VGGSGAGQLGPVLGGTMGVDCCLGWCLRARCSRCIVECITSASTFIILVQNTMYQNLNLIYNIFRSEYLICGLYVCTCKFSLHRESFDVILYDTHISMMGVLHLVSELCRS